MASDFLTFVGIAVRRVLLPRVVAFVANDFLIVFVIAVPLVLRPRVAFVANDFLIVFLVIAVPFVAVSVVIVVAIFACDGVAVPFSLSSTTPSFSGDADDFESEFEESEPYDPNRSIIITIRSDFVLAVCMRNVYLF